MRGTARSGLRRSVGPARRLRAQRRPRRLSGRAVAIMVIFIAFVLAYAFPVQRLLAQESEIDRMESAQQAQRDHIRELTQQLARWNDDDYVAAQARSRLHLVRQGELLYVVGADPAVPSPGQESQNPTWYGQLWANLQAADSPVS